MAIEILTDYMYMYFLQFFSRNQVMFLWNIGLVITCDFGNKHAPNEQYFSRLEKKMLWNEWIRLGFFFILRVTLLVSMIAEIIFSHCLSQIFCMQWHAYCSCYWCSHYKFLAIMQSVSLFFVFKLCFVF